MKARSLAVLVACHVLVAACADERLDPLPEVRTRSLSAVEYGAELFRSPAFSGSRFNTFACSTCHASADGETRILPGYDLHGVVQRPRTWGGNERDLLAAVNVCLVYFMRGDPLTRDDTRGRALYEYLASLSGDQATRPMTVVKNVADVPRGDVVRGQEVFERACRDCHGELHTGAGALTDLASVLPDVRDEYNDLFPGVPHGLVFVEKVRHGQFYGIGGNMPFFSTEALSDEDLGALLAYFQL